MSSAPRTRTLGALLLALCALPLACRSVQPVDLPTGGTWYTQASMQYERGRYRTTNYRRGLLLPVNSEVELLSINSRRAEVRVRESGETLLIESMPQHTGKAMLEEFRTVFAEQPLDLSVFDEETRQAIRLGRAQPGMSKDAVFAALGPPPATRTPSLEAGEWIYWDSRMTTFAVVFDADGKVAELRD